MEPADPLGADAGYKELDKILFGPGKTRSPRPRLVRRIQPTGHRRRRHTEGRRSLPMAARTGGGTEGGARQKDDYVVFRRDRWFRKNGDLEVHYVHFPMFPFLLRRELQGYEPRYSQVFMETKGGPRQPSENGGWEGVLWRAGGNQGWPHPKREVRGGF